MTIAKPVRRYEIRKHISAPHDFDLLIHVDDQGRFETFGAHLTPPYDYFVDCLVMRACLYCGAVVFSGVAVRKVMAEIPKTKEFELERAIMSAFIAWLDECALVNQQKSAVLH